MALRRPKVVCLLSAYDGEEFQTSGKVPPCSEHRHVSRGTAERMQNEITWLAETVAAWRDVRVLRPVRSGGFATLQLVKPR